MDKKKNKRRSNGHGWIQETALIFRPYNQGWWTRKTIMECQNMWKQEKKKTAHKMHSLNKFAMNKEGTNNELMRKTENREGWRAMIVDVCKTRPDN
ncbi:hypothetical protein PoB_006658400 [Plakobranchus ocellatus]|uniref:Uncharacterized protein n=1 Tax=Plakobranchus ocellatus TaxID=259542 RepID=A0AAV4D7F2_9GAST|nr:hypothetical protein PoB_006658400 [Plakobranchus ocellatus]